MRYETDVRPKLLGLRRGSQKTANIQRDVTT